MAYVRICLKTYETYVKPNSIEHFTCFVFLNTLRKNSRDYNLKYDIISSTREANSLSTSAIY